MISINDADGGVMEDNKVVDEAVKDKAADVNIEEVKDTNEMADIKTEEDNKAKAGKEVKPKKQKVKKEKKSKDTGEQKKGIKVLKFMLKHWFLSLILILIIYMTISTLISRAKNGNKKYENINVETAMIERTDVTTTVSGTGTIVAGEIKEIIVDDMSTYKILNMNVKVGDTVKAGDVLCVFDTEELSLDLADAEAELNKINIQSGNNVATTKRNVNDTEIDKVTQTYRDIDAADKAQRILDTKKGELAEAQRIYDKEYEIFNNIYSEDKYYSLLEKQAKGDEMSASEMEDFQAMNTAKSTLASLKSQIDAAQTAVNTAQDALTRAQESYTDNVRHGITSIENAHDTLEDAYASNSTARLGTQKTIRNYEAKLDATEVVSPIDGIITGVAVEEGNRYTGGVLFKIEDTSAYKVEVNIEEYDISDIAVGQKVVIKTNATGTDELEGIVSAVAPKAVAVAASSTSTTPSYKVTIDIKTKNDRIRMDMTAKVIITTNESAGVLAVPSEAIKTDDEGNTYINVGKKTVSDAADVLDADVDSMSFLDRVKYESDKQQAENGGADKQKVYVTVGLESSYYSEIAGDGIEEGMTVYLADDEVPKKDDKGNPDVLGGI